MARETLNLSNPLDESDLKIVIEGESQMPFWHHDLAVKAILKLLTHIDIKDYINDNKIDEGYKSAVEIIEATKAAFGLDFEE